MSAESAPLIRDLPPVVDLRPVPKAPKPADALRTRIIESPSGPDGRPRAPRREVCLGVPGYPGFELWLWANYPQAVRLDLVGGDGERGGAALRRTVVEHNNWCDADGEPYPPADDPAFWDAIPFELGLVVAHLVLHDATAAYPNSLSPTGGN